MNITLNNKENETACEECAMPVTQAPEGNKDKILKCVRCPFCKQTVNATLTKTHISCPKCEVSVALI